MNVNAQAKDGYTLLHYAGQTGYVYVAAYLIDHNANIDAENDSNNTPLDVALEWGEATTALLLLDAGATATETVKNSILREATEQNDRYTVSFRQA